MLTMTPKGLFTFMVLYYLSPGIANGFFLIRVRTMNMEQQIVFDAFYVDKTTETLTIPYSQFRGLKTLASGNASTFIRFTEDREYNLNVDMPYVLGLWKQTASDMFINLSSDANAVPKVPLASAAAPTLEPPGRS
jgi:hypothetical protein